jgi:FAD/FMN-containing dehydrogenase
MLPPDYRLNREINAADIARRDQELDQEVDRARELKKSGRLISMAEAGWDLARRAWNLAVDQRPRHVAFPETADEVVSLIAFAKAKGLGVVPQGTGHGAAPVDRLEDCILLRPTRMRSVKIDPTRSRARVGAGVTWGEVQAAAAPHGLAGLAGSSPEVGVLGYTLGGGLGWLARRYGLACNSVISFDVVTADGHRITADENSESELFWALRGGGGSFGVVTALEFALYPVKQLYAGSMFWPQERAGEILHAWREWTAGVPDSVTSVGRLLNLPRDPHVPESLRDRSFVLVEAACLTSEADGREILRPLRELAPANDTFAMLPPKGLGALHMDPAEPTPVSIDGWVLSDLPAAAVDAVVGAAGPGSGSALLSFEVRHLGGALLEEGPQHGALAALEGRFGTAAVGLVPTPEAADTVGHSTALIRSALAPWLAERHYANFARPNAPVEEFHSAATSARLERAKAHYDPDDRIRTVHSVPVA